MASSPLSTPTATPARRMAMNRSFTVPAKIATPPRQANTPAEIGATEGVETLYVHPNANIIKFTSFSRPSSSASASPGRPGSSQGTQPWASPTERTMAAGPMEIYRVPGSVSFLHSGALLHAILPRSQCWCVDGVSKFALRVLPDTFYRIELPGETEEDLQEVEKLKVTLHKVLFYERTPCPFLRTFTVDLPEELEVKKQRRKSSGPVKKWKLERASSWRPDGWVPPSDGEQSASAGEEEEHEDDGSEDGNDSEASDLADSRQDVMPSTPSRPRIALGMRSITAPSQTAVHSPSPSKLRTRVDADGTVEVSEVIPPGSTASATPVTRTLQAIPTDMPPSPPDSSVGVDYVESQAQAGAEAVDDHGESENVTGEEATLEPSIPMEPSLEAHNIAETQATASTDDDVTKELENTEPSRSMESAPNEHAVTATATVEDSVDDTTSQDLQEQSTTLETDPSSRPVTPEAAPTHDDPYAAIQARILARRSIGGTTVFHPGRTSPTRKSTSSNSSTATISSNKSGASLRSQSSHQQQAFATAMVRKACSAFLGPPARLVAIMLQIAARYADAAFGMNSVFYVESPIDWPRKVPGSYNLEEELHELDSDWEEDDFGVPLRSPVRLAGRAGDSRRRKEEGGWGVD